MDKWQVKYEKNGKIKTVVKSGNDISIELDMIAELGIERKDIKEMTLIGGGKFNGKVEEIR